MVQYTTVPKTHGLQLSSRGNLKSRWGDEDQRGRPYCPLGDEQLAILDNTKGQGGSLVPVKV